MAREARRQALFVRVLAAAILATLAASCSTEDAPKATAACKASSAKDACETCCAANGTNASRFDSGAGCTCVLRYWIFLQ